MEIDEKTSSATDGAGDVDNDCNNLLQEFSRMGTTDRDVLISRMQQFITGLSCNEGAFFLEMNNWNLDAALWSYFELSQNLAASTIGPMPNWTVQQSPRSMSLVEDLTIGNGEAVPPNTSFVKTLRLKNTGVQAWPDVCTFKYVDGENLRGKDVHLSRPVLANEEVDLVLHLTSPLVPGSYESRWRLYDLMGPFGETITVRVDVQQDGILAVTQQMDACHA